MTIFLQKKVHYNTRMEFLNRGSTKQKIVSVLDKKRKENPIGFAAAERIGNLAEYIAPELRAAGISCEDFRASMGAGEALTSEKGTTGSTSDANKPSPSMRSSSESRTRGNRVERSGRSSQSSMNTDYFRLVSDALDEHVFKQLYTDTPSTTTNKYFAEALAATKSPKVLNALNNFKVCCAAASVLCLGLAAQSLSARSIPKVAVFAILGFDCAKMSYNCYIKKYCSDALHHLFGDTMTTGQTLFASVKAAVGLADPTSDPLLRLKHGIIYEVIYQHTLTKHIYDKICRSLTA